MSKEIEFITLGCRVNFFESELIKQHFEKINIPKDKLIIINTCSVTGEADRQSRQLSRKARKDNPESYILITGCSVEANRAEYEQMGTADEIWDNAQKQQILKGKTIRDYHNKCKAFILCQMGCDHQCTYCIVPSLRGKAESLAISHILKEAQNLSDRGYKELILTGIDLGSYNFKNKNLSDLIEEIYEHAHNLQRLRLGSIDPLTIDHKMFKIIENPKFMPHIHLSIQSGDDFILKKMARRHRRNDIIKLCQKLREIKPDIAIGADFITGFPNETEEMFAGTINLVKECVLTHLHVFPYSERKGTAAALMDNQVPINERRARAKILRQIGDEAHLSFMQKFIGSELEVLAEQDNYGSSPHFLSVKFSNNAKIGDIIKLKITGIKGKHLIA